MRLRHLHLPGLTPYLRASAIQDHFVRIQLDHKKAPSTSPAPNPFLLTFQTPPTYTCGRREVGTLTSDQIDHLKAGGKAEFYEALRGGQTTFHGPENPGVWIGQDPDDRKLASVGVHLRRHVSSHGIGLNVNVDLGWFDRIVACGLVGKKATNIEREISLSSQGADSSGAPPMSDVASKFAAHVAERLGNVGEHVDTVNEIDVLPETLLIDALPETLVLG
ncbi:hypothetical protein P7C71_g2996, partial [Lecanoromycetidae sp. Uapishka_2]